MNNTIQYLNTDLDLTSPNDLTSLAAEFESKGIFALHVTHCDDGQWFATFETQEGYEDPESNISGMLAVIESLDAPLRTIWSRCIRKQFNVGYDCGAEPWEFNQGISAEVLGRMATAGGALRITLYPDREPVTRLPQAGEGSP